MSDNSSLDSGQLADSQIPSGTDPFALFDDWFAMAQGSEPNDPNAMALATADANARPSVRMVLLKGHGRSEGADYGVAGGGFTFFTNMGSRKGTDIAANMQAAILFHWKSLRRQIRIEGRLVEVSPAYADAYFHSRPFKSQVGSAASDQSRPLPQRQTYIDRVEECARSSRLQERCRAPITGPALPLRPNGSSSGWIAITACTTGGCLRWRAQATHCAGPIRCFTRERLRHDANDPLLARRCLQRPPLWRQSGGSDGAG